MLQRRRRTPPRSSVDAARLQQCEKRNDQRAIEVTLKTAAAERITRSLRTIREHRTRARACQVDHQPHVDDLALLGREGADHERFPRGLSHPLRRICSYFRC